MKDDEFYSDEAIARMDAAAEEQEAAHDREELIRLDREALRQSLDLLSRLYDAWRTNQDDLLNEAFDSEVYGFLSANHPDWTPDE